MGLTAKQERFVQEYLADPNLNATAAYRRAYPKCKTENAAAVSASQLLRNPKIQQAVGAARKELEKRAEIDAAWVLRRLVRNHNRAAAVVPVLDKEGNEVGQYTYQGAVANKALELIGRHLGMFEDERRGDYPPVLGVLVIEVDRNGHANGAKITNGTGNGHANGDGPGASLSPTRRGSGPLHVEVNGGGH